MSSCGRVAGVVRFEAWAWLGGGEGHHRVKSAEGQVQLVLNHLTSFSLSTCDVLVILLVQIINQCEEVEMLLHTVYKQRHLPAKVHPPHGIQSIELQPYPYYNRVRN